MQRFVLDLTYEFVENNYMLLQVWMKGVYNLCEMCFNVVTRFYNVKIITYITVVLIILRKI